MTEFLKVTFAYSQPNASTPNTVHFFRVTGYADDTALATAVNAWFNTVYYTAWSNLANTSATIVSYNAQIVDVTGLVLRNIANVTSGGGGTITGEVTSAAISGAIFAATVRPQSRGRKYVPGMAETLVQDGAFNASGVAKLSAYLIMYLATYNAANGTVMVPGILSTAVAAFLDFNASGGYSDIPSYQRRRKPFVGS